MSRTAVLGIGSLLVLGACTSSGDDGPAATTATTATTDSASGSGSTGSESGGSESGESESGEPGSESGDPTETGTETGDMCTGETCNSTLTMTFTHALPLLEGPHRFYIQTPVHELTCSVEATLEGQKSCFGFAFSDLSWTEEAVTVVMTNPFFDTVINPEATPFESVSVQVEVGDQTLFDAVVPVEGGEVMMPDPCGLSCWHATAEATIP